MCIRDSNVRYTLHFYDKRLGLDVRLNEDLNKLIAAKAQVTKVQRKIDEYAQKVISVSVARPRAEKPSYGGNRGGGYNQMCIRDSVSNCGLSAISYIVFY